MSDDYYVYVYEDPISKVPFYVGKGRKGRITYHLTMARGVIDGKSRFIKHLATMLGNGVEPIVKKVSENLTSKSALDLEGELIAKYGRIGYDEDGVLLNVKRRGFGNGWVHTEETKAKIRKSTNDCIKDGRMKTWATSLTKEERARNVTKGNKSRAKPLYAYSQIDGSFLKEFPPYNETVALLNVKTAHLSLALKDKCFPCGGYLWSHERLDNLGVTEKDVLERQQKTTKPKNAKSIIQTFPDGTKKTWESMSALIREMGGHARMIDKIIATGSEWHGCIWCR